MRWRPRPKTWCVTAWPCTFLAAKWSRPSFCKHATGSLPWRCWGGSFAKTSGMGQQGEDAQGSAEMKCRFFPFVAADLALRLGPDSERSGRKVCKKYKTFWLHKTNRNTATATTRKSPARFVFRQQRKQRNNTKRGRSKRGWSHTRKTHKSMDVRR